jgi:hypothetical protein
MERRLLKPGQEATTAKPTSGMVSQLFSINPFSPSILYSTNWLL